MQGQTNLPGNWRESRNGFINIWPPDLWQDDTVVQGIKYGLLINNPDHLASHEE